MCAASCCMSCQRVSSVSGTMGCWRQRPSGSSWRRRGWRYRCRLPIRLPLSLHRHSCSGCRSRTFCNVRPANVDAYGSLRCWSRLRVCRIRAVRRKWRRQPAGGRRESGGVGSIGYGCAAVATCCKPGAMALREAVCHCRSNAPKAKPMPLQKVWIAHCNAHSRQRRRQMPATVASNRYTPTVATFTIPIATTSRAV